MAKKILFVDDEPMPRMITEMAFKAAGFEITACEDLQQAIGALQTPGQKFDAVVTDGMYPGIAPHAQFGSLNLLTFLKDNAALCPPAVLMITGTPHYLQPLIDGLGDSCVRPDMHTKLEPVADIARALKLRLG